MQAGGRTPLATLLIVLVMTGFSVSAAGRDEVLGNLIDRGDYHAALALVDAALEGRPGDRSMLLHRGFLLVSLGRLGEAETHYRSMQSTLPDAPEPGNNLAVVYRNQGRLHDALLELDRVIAAHPLFEQAHHNLVDICGGMDGEDGGHDPVAVEFCRGFDHDAAIAAREAAREATPNIVERDEVVAVMALRPVQLTSAPLDEDDGDAAATETPGIELTLRRELSDLAAEFEAFRGRAAAELESAGDARAAAEKRFSEVAGRNVMLERELAAATAELTTLREALRETEGQRDAADRAAAVANNRSMATRNALDWELERRMAAEQAAETARQALDDLQSRYRELAAESDSSAQRVEVGGEDALAGWQRELDDGPFAGDHLAPPDHIRWQVEHVLGRWFRTYAEGDVDGHRALYAPGLTGSGGASPAASPEQRFSAPRDGPGVDHDPALTRMRLIAADSVEVYLPGFHSLPGVPDGRVEMLQLQYRQGRWQITLERNRQAD